jgi:hypothetical protein
MMMSSCLSLLWSTSKTPSRPVLKACPEDFDLDAIKLPKFHVPSSTPLSPRRRLLDRLHAVAVPGNRAVCSTFTTVPVNHAVCSAFTAAPGNHVVALIHRPRTTPPPPRPPPQPPPSSPSGPCCSAVTGALGNRIDCPVVTAIGSTSPNRHCHAREPCRPPSHHRHWVHVAQRSPLPSPRRLAVTTTGSTPP